MYSALILTLVLAVFAGAAALLNRKSVLMIDPDEDEWWRAIK